MGFGGQDQEVDGKRGVYVLTLSEFNGRLLLEAQGSANTES